MPLTLALDSQIVVPCFGNQQISVACNPSSLQIFYFNREFISPQVYLIEPIDNSEDTDTIVNFKYNVSDSSSISNCSLYFDDVLYTTDNSITKDITQEFIVHNPPVKDDLVWYVECIDMWSNAGNSTKRHLDTSLGGGSPTSGGGGGVTKKTILKKYGLTDISELLCNLTFNSSLKNFSKYTQIENIQKVYLNQTNNSISFSTVKTYIDNWNEICNFTEKKTLSVFPVEEFDYTFLIWILLISIVIVVTILLIYKKKKVLILLGWDEED